jgi:hypothetical protein
MSDTSTLQRDRNADKDRETEQAQIIIDACEQLIHIAAERDDAADELFWCKLSEMALKGPDRS